MNVQFSYGLFPWIMFSVGGLMATTLILSSYLIFSKKSFFCTDFEPSRKIRKSSGLLIFNFFLSYAFSLPFTDQFLTLEYSRLAIARVFVDFLLITPALFSWLFTLLQDSRRYNHFIYSSIPVPIGLLIWFLLTGNKLAIVITRYFWLIYATVSAVHFLVRLYRYQKDLKNNFTDGTHHSLMWLLILLILGGSCFLINILGIDVDTKFSWVFFLYYLLEFSMCVFITYIADNQCLISEEHTNGENETARSSVINVGQEENDLEWIGSRLKNINEDEKLYLNPDIDSLTLAHTIGTNRTYLSRYLNSKGDNFNHYINELRIGYALKLIDESKEKPNLTEIARACGYKQMNSFRSAFKARTGSLPSEYINKLFDKS